MDREIKFEVLIKHKTSGNFFKQVLTLEELLNRNGSLYHQGIQEVVYKRQFIGLTDKNGKEVYERDYLRCGDLFVEIVFQGGQFVGIDKDNGHEIQNRNWLQFEVIGNAFETTLPSKFDM